MVGPVALVLIVLWTLAVLFVPFGVVPPVWLGAAILGVVLWRSARARAWLGHPWHGTLDRTAVVVMTATVVIAAIALTVWAASQPRLEMDGAAIVSLGEQSPLDEAIDRARSIPLWIFPLAALVFALVNAMAEELVYRGVVMRALLPLGSRRAILLQAAAFGVIHLDGFPSGWWGVAMTVLYGAVLGWLRLRTRGLAAPFSVHVTADLVIAFLVRFGYG